VTSLLPLRVILLLLPLTMFATVLLLHNSSISSTDLPVAEKLLQQQQKSSRTSSSEVLSDYNGNDIAGGGGAVLRVPENLPGENGKGYKPENLTASEKKLVGEGWKKNAFNQFVSDAISIRRSLPDPRDQWYLF